MAPAAAEPADGGLLKQFSFSKGDWAEEYPIDIGYDRILSLVRVATPADTEIEVVTAQRLLATAYCATEHDQLLAMGPESFLAHWESLIETRQVRHGAETGAAAGNALVTALGRTDSKSAALAVRIVKAAKGTMELMNSVRNLPQIGNGRVELTAFTRLAKTSAQPTMETERLRSLAARVRVTTPADGEVDEEAREKWVWALSLLTRSITTKAVGFLAIAHAGSLADWTAALAALSSDGRFTPAYMAAERQKQRQARSGASAAAQRFDAAATPVQAWAHVVADIADDALKQALAKALALVSVDMHKLPLSGASFDLRAVAVGKAVLAAARSRNQALAAVPKLPATSEVEAIQAMVEYFFPPEPASAATTPGVATTPAGGGATGATVMTLTQETLEALRGSAAQSDLLSAGSEKIVLGKAPATKGSLKRPEYFATGDVVDFQRHEAALIELNELDHASTNVW